MTVRRTLWCTKLTFCQWNVCPAEPSGCWWLVGNKAGDLVPGQSCQECSSQAYDRSTAEEQSWTSSSSHHLYRDFLKAAKTSQIQFTKFTRCCVVIGAVWGIRPINQSIRFRISIIFTYDFLFYRFTNV